MCARRSPATPTIPVSPVRDHEPSPGFGVQVPLDLPVARLIDPEDLKWRQRFHQDGVDVFDERREATGQNTA